MGEVTVAAQECFSDAETQIRFMAHFILNFIYCKALGRTHRRLRFAESLGPLAS
jgi:hypothetical protein